MRVKRLHWCPWCGQLVSVTEAGKLAVHPRVIPGPFHLADTLPYGQCAGSGTRL